MKIFWSYAKLDNKKPHKLTKLRKAFSRALDETTGSSNKIFVDEIDLQWGVPWKQEIEKLIFSSDAMISILTPSFFNSRMCIYEYKFASENGIKLYPLYFREVKNGFKSTFKEDDNEENICLNQASRTIGELQYKDFRKLRNKDLDSEIVQDFLDGLANEIS